MSAAGSMASSPEPMGALLRDSVTSSVGSYTGGGTGYQHPYLLSSNELLSLDPPPLYSPPTLPNTIGLDVIPSRPDSPSPAHFPQLANIRSNSFSATSPTASGTTTATMRSPSKTISAKHFPRGHAETVKLISFHPEHQCNNFLHGVLGHTGCCVKGTVVISLSAPLKAKRVFLRIRLAGIERVFTSVAGSMVAESDVDFGMGDLPQTPVALPSPDWTYRPDSRASMFGGGGPPPANENDYFSVPRAPSYPRYSPSGNARVYYEESFVVFENSVEGGDIGAQLKPQDAELMSAGVHSFQFMFDDLPDWLPGSFHGEHSSVSYVLEALLETHHHTAIECPISQPSQPFRLALGKLNFAPTQSRVTHRYTNRTLYAVEIPIPRFHSLLIKHSCLLSPAAAFSPSERAEKFVYVADTDTTTQSSPPPIFEDSSDASNNNSNNNNNSTTLAPSQIAADSNHHNINHNTVSIPSTSPDPTTVLSNHSSKSSIKFTCLLPSPALCRIGYGLPVLLHLSKVAPGIRVAGVELTLVQIETISLPSRSQRKSSGSPVVSGSPTMAGPSFPAMRNSASSTSSSSSTTRVFENIIGSVVDYAKSSGDYFNKSFIVPCKPLKHTLASISDIELFPAGNTAAAAAAASAVTPQLDESPIHGVGGGTRYNMASPTPDIAATPPWVSTSPLGLGILGLGISEQTNYINGSLITASPMLRGGVASTTATTTTRLPPPALTTSAATNTATTTTTMKLMTQVRHELRVRWIVMSGAAIGVSPVANGKETYVDALTAPVVVHGLNDETIEILGGYVADPREDGTWAGRLRRLEYRLK